MSGEGPGGTGRFPQQKRPLKEGGSWEKHGFPHESEAELAGSVVGQSPTTRPNHGASDSRDEEAGRAEMAAADLAEHAGDKRPRRSLVPTRPDDGDLVANRRLAPRRHRDRVHLPGHGLDVRDVDET